MKKTALLLLFVVLAVLCMAADASANPPVVQVRTINAVSTLGVEVIPTNRVFVNEFVPFGFVGQRRFAVAEVPLAVPVAPRLGYRALPLRPLLLRPRVLVLP